MDSQSLPPENFRNDLVEQRDYMMRVAMNRCRNAAQAEDLVQTTMMKALNSWHQFEPGTNFKAWLARIITNTFLSDRRSKYFSTRIDDPDGLFEDRMVSNLPGPEGGMTVEAVFRAIDKLPKDQKDAIFMVIEGCSYEEMARRANCAIGTAKSRVNRAREALAAMLPGEEMDFLDSRWADLAGTKPVLLGPHAGPRLLSAPSHAALPPAPHSLPRRPAPLALPAPKRSQPEHKIPPLVSRLENNEKDADVELPIQQEEEVSMSMPQPVSDPSSPAMTNAPDRVYDQAGIKLTDTLIASDVSEIFDAYAAIGVTSSAGMITEENLSLPAVKLIPVIKKGKYAGQVSPYLKLLDETGEAFVNAHDRFMADRPSSTASSYLVALNGLAQFLNARALPLIGVDSEVMHAFIENQLSFKQAKTVSAQTSMLRVYFSALADEQLYPKNPLERIGFSGKDIINFERLTNSPHSSNIVIPENNIELASTVIMEGQQPPSAPTDSLTPPPPTIGGCVAGGAVKTRRRREESYREAA